MRNTYAWHFLALPFDPKKNSTGIRGRRLSNARRNILLAANDPLFSTNGDISFYSHDNAADHTFADGQPGGQVWLHAKTRPGINDSSMPYRFVKLI